MNDNKIINVDSWNIGVPYDYSAFQEVQDNVLPVLDSGQGAGIFNGFAFNEIIVLPILVTALLLLLTLAGLWKMFEKAGHPGWKAIIPIYNTIILFRMVGRTGWLIIGYFIPYVGIAVVLWLNVMLAKSFGKSYGTALGLTFLPFIFNPMIGFGDAKYKKPKVSKEDLFACEE